ncbi:MAG: insulinase family protein, partial [Clostridiaceae bacterium]|nr:insulinase family protein [Clostridiaceae bacterium]
MLNTDALEYKDINETMYKYDHKSGLRVFFIPKRGYTKKYAAFAINFGSINTEFIEKGQMETTIVPEGVAHFLEHILFEQKDGNIMEKFSLLGSKPNAYTSFNQTVYLFSCTDNFYENLDLLLNFVQNPNFVDESIEKEKNIIKQEINMYRDNASWRSLFNFLGILYKNNKVRNEILGTPESIDKINKDILLKCYNNFYTPENMIVCVVGDIEKDGIFSRIDKNIKTSATTNDKSINDKNYDGKNNDERNGMNKELNNDLNAKIPNTGNSTEIKRIFPEEPDDINLPYTEQRMHISIPYFHMGYKDNSIKKNSAKDKLELLKRELSLKILLEMIMGRSSNLFKFLYEQGLINNTFNFNYTSEENYAHSLISGESKNPHKVKDIILKYIDDNIDRLSEEDFTRVRNAMYGKNLRWFNSIETISANFVTSIFKGIYLFDY